jgi:gliding motility-associated-like protein
MAIFSHSFKLPNTFSGRSIAFFFVLIAFSVPLSAQTVIFSNPGKTYTNTDEVTTDTYNIPNIGNCSSVSFSMNFNFSLGWVGSGNMESNDECPFSPSPCLPDPDPANAETGACANCWDFLYVQYQVDGVTVYSRLVGIPGDLAQSGTVTFPPICTQNASNASIIVQTNTWAANESVTFSNITVTCWDAMSAPAANPNPACFGQTVNLTGNLVNAPSVGSSTWSGPGTIAAPNSVNTSVTNVPLGTSTYVLTTTDDNNCTETNDVEVTVNPGPTMDNPGPQSGCAGQPVAVNFTGTGVTYNWTNSNTAIGLGASGTGDLSFTAANVSATTTANITVTPIDGPCMGTPVTFPIVISPGPTMNAVNNVTQCGGTFVSVSFAGGAAGTMYEWTNDNTDIGLAGTGTGNINFNSANVAMQEIANITVTPVNAAGCEGPPRNFTIRINPGLIVDQPDNITVCAGDDIDVTFTGTGVNYTWTSTNSATGVPNSGAGNISVTSPVFTGLQEVTTVTVLATGGCPGPASTFTITVRPSSEVSPVANVAVCSGQPVVVNFTSQPNNVAPTWFNNNTAIGLPISGTGNLSFNAANVTTPQTSIITVQSILSACSGPAITFNITVSPGPSMNTVPDISICGGGNIAAAFSGAGAGATYSWTNSNPAIGIPATGTGNISATAASPTTTQTATITVTPAIGTCMGPARTFTITVNASPTMTIPANVTVCAGQPVAVNFSGTTGSNFNWTNTNTAIGLGAMGSGNIAFTTPAALAATQISTITVTPQIGTCPGAPVNFTITANVPPTLTVSTVTCAPNLLTYTVVITSNAASLTATAGTIAPSGGGFTISLIPAGSNISITATSAASCTSQTTVNAPNCNCPPVAAPTTPNNPAICEGATIPALTVVATAGLQVNWYSAASGGMTLVSNTASFTPVGPFTAGTYTFFAETRDPATGCLSTTRTPVTLTVNASPTMTMPANVSVCAGQPVAINFSGSSGATFNWINNNVNIGIPATGSGNIAFNTPASLSTSQVATIAVTPQIGTCPGTPVNFTINIGALPVITIGTISCSSDLQTYSVAVTTTNTQTLNSSAGTIAGSGGSFFVSQIPAGTNITLNATSSATCQSQQAVTAPNCNCPSVPIAGNPNSPTICDGTPIPALTVTANAGLQVDWFANPTGGTAIATNTLSFTPTGTLTPGTYTFYAEAKDPVTGCVANRTPVILTIDATPTMNTVSSNNLCAGNMVTANFTGTAGATFAWTNSNANIGLPASGNGNISFTPPANLATTQLSTIIVTPTLGTCPGTPVNFTITANANPVITIGTVQCAPSLLTYSVALTTTNGATITASVGTVTGSAGNFTIANIPAGINVDINASTSAFCAANQTVNAPNCNCPPVAPASNPSNPSACQGTPIPALSVTAGAGLQVNWFLTATGGAPIVTNMASLTPPGASYPPGVYTFYAETLDPTTGCVSPTRTPVTLTVTAAPTLTTPASITVCAEQAIIVNFNGTAMSTFNWTNNNTGIGLNQSAGTGNISFTVSPDIEMVEVATIQVTPQLGTCLGTPVTFTITANPLPTLDIGLIQCTPPALTSYSINLNSDAVTLIATSGTVVNNGGGDYSITNIPEGTNIVLLATGANGCKASQNINSPNCNCPPVALPANPSNPTICVGSTVPTLAVTVAAGLQVNWFATATGGTPLATNTLTYLPTIPSQVGIYTFYVESLDPATNCTSASRTPVVVTVAALPTAAITINSGTNNICAGTTAILTATGGGTYLWNTIATTASVALSPLITTTYTVTVTNANNCKATATYTLVVNLPYNVTVNLTTCDPAAVGTKVLNLKTVNNCDSTVNIITTLNTSNCAPVVNVENGSVDCSGDADGSLSIVPTDGIAPYTYNWSGNSQSGSGTIATTNGTGLIEDLSPGNYTITVTGSNGISTTATGIITAPPPFSAIASLQLKPNGFGLSCESGSDGAINSVANGGTSPYTYQWSSNQTTANITGLKAGTYTVTITDSKGCTATATATVTSPDVIQLGFSALEPECNKNTLGVTMNPSGGSAPFTYKLDGASVTGPRIDVPEGTHVILVTDNAGCSRDTTVTIDLPNPVVISLPATKEVNLGNPIEIEAQTTLLTWESIVWSPLRDTLNADTLIQKWIAANSEVITVTITNIDGCTDTARIAIIVKNDIQIFIPNVFTIDADNNNGIWHIFGGPAIALLQKVHVFDRWGSSVYLWDEPTTLDDWPGWDGFVKGKPSNPGVYVYYVKVKLTNGEEILLKGDVTVLR